MTDRRATSPSETGRRPGSTRIAAWMTALLFLAAGAAVLPRVGLSWDEPIEHYKAGLALDYAASFGADTSLLHFSDARYYGTFFNLVAALAERALSGVAWFRIWHALTLLFGAVGVAASARLAGALGGARAAWLAGLLLATTPRWLGHAIFTPKDVPIAALFALASVALSDLAARLPGAPIRSWLRFGALAGLACAVRLGGLLLLGLAALLALATWQIEKRARGRDVDDGPRFRPALLGLLAAGGVAGAVLWPFWPYLHTRPGAHLLELLAVQQAFPWPNRVLFFGEWRLPVEIARAYLPVWLAIGLPLGLLGGVLLSPLARHESSTVDPGTWRRRIGAVVATALVPVALVFVRGVPLYDGLRQMLFVLPPLAALAATGWIGLLDRLRSRPIRIATSLLLAATLLEPVLWIARARDLAYVYFQPLAGGVRAASWNFDADYWGLALHEVAPTLDRLAAGRSATDPLRVRIVRPRRLRNQVIPFLAAPERVRWVGDDQAGSAEVEVLLGRWFPNPLGHSGPVLDEVRIVDGQRPLALVHRLSPTLTSSVGDPPGAARPEAGPPAP